MNFTKCANSNFHIVVLVLMMNAWTSALVKPKQDHPHANKIHFYYWTNDYWVLYINKLVEKRARRIWTGKILLCPQILKSCYHVLYSSVYSHCYTCQFLSLQLSPAPGFAGQACLTVGKTHHCVCIQVSGFESWLWCRFWLLLLTLAHPGLCPIHNRRPGLSPGS